jgi:hypothetical protein
MKQYTAAVSDLYRSGQSYREERVLVRRAGAASTAQGDVGALTALAPADAAFYEAEATPDPEKLLDSLRENLIEEKAEQSQAAPTTAPLEAEADNAGSAQQLDVPIDRAPVSVVSADAYRPLRALLAAQQPDAVLEVYSSRAPQKDAAAGVFVTLQTAVVISAPQPWNQDAVTSALTAALPANLSAGKIGTGWIKRTSASGEYLELNGALPLYAAVNAKQLFLANDSVLIEHLLASHRDNSLGAASKGVTYAALFKPHPELSNFHKLMAQLDLAGHRGNSDQQTAADGQAPAFFSGNISSLGRVYFNSLDSERVEERDLGAEVKQTVTYQWSR